MQRDCQEHMAFKEMRRQAEKEEEEAFRKMMLAKFAEDDRVEQMNDRKRRMKQLEHKREVEKLIEDRRRQREADMVQIILFVHNYMIITECNGAFIVLLSAVVMLMWHCGRQQRCNQVLLE